MKSLALHILYCCTTRRFDFLQIALVCVAGALISIQTVYSSESFGPVVVALQEPVGQASFPETHGAYNRDTSDDPECSICLEGLRDPQFLPIRTLYCRHSFHRVCIAAWEKRQETEEITHTCPYCRANAAHVSDYKCDICNEGVLKGDSELLLYCLIKAWSYGYGRAMDSEECEHVFHPHCFWHYYRQEGNHHQGADGNHIAHCPVHKPKPETPKYECMFAEITVNDGAGKALAEYVQGTPPDNKPVSAELAALLNRNSDAEADEAYDADWYYDDPIYDW